MILSMGLVMGLALTADPAQVAVVDTVGPGKTRVSKVIFQVAKTVLKDAVVSLQPRPPAWTTTKKLVDAIAGMARDYGAAAVIDSTVSRKHVLTVTVVARDGKVLFQNLVALPGKNIEAAVKPVAESAVRAVEDYLASPKEAAPSPPAEPSGSQPVASSTTPAPETAPDVGSTATGLPTPEPAATSHRALVGQARPDLMRPALEPVAPWWTPLFRNIGYLVGGAGLLGAAAGAYYGLQAQSKRDAIKRDAGLSQEDAITRDRQASVLAGRANLFFLVGGSIAAVGAGLAGFDW
ncbi:MAG: hypothetical protein AAB426_12810, partial [Myxococcota bacterium]